MVPPEVTEAVTQHAGQPFLVDNSVLQAPEKRLGYRRSMSLDDKLETPGVEWGKIVYLQNLL